jgi:hypothetical protein
MLSAYNRAPAVLDAITVQRELQNRIAPLRHASHTNAVTVDCVFKRRDGTMIVFQAGKAAHNSPQFKTADCAPSPQTETRLIAQRIKQSAQV